EAADAIQSDLASNRRSLLVLATGLGKTFVGGEVIRRHLRANPGTSVLVTAHMKELVEQLERALWRHLDKTIPTHLLPPDIKPPAVIRPRPLGLGQGRGGRLVIIVCCGQSK